ncbi:MAG TPA: hypothetical protein VKP69_01745, partial [Isosphaeraceae bacterium]|nr:hypothetical protein [Isosphaeraceae bacterium]
MPRPACGWRRSGGRELQGRVALTSWLLDGPSRTLRAEVDLPNPEGQLRPGMRAVIKIALDRRDEDSPAPTANGPARLDRERGGRRCSSAREAVAVHTLEPLKTRDFVS